MLATFLIAVTKYLTEVTGMGGGFAWSRVLHPLLLERCGIRFSQFIVPGTFYPSQKARN